MALCDCGEITGRLLMKCTASGGKPLPWPWRSVCPACDPAAFPQARIELPSNKRLWLTAEVEPNEYETRDGVRQMKDWAQAEFEERLATPDEEEAQEVERARERKRAQARAVRTVYGDTLSADKVRQIREQVANGAARAEAEEVGLVLP